MTLIDFTIKNYRSYRDETTFSFEALDENFREENTFTVELEDGRKLHLLKSAAIFGANASGKSNIIWALHTLSLMVRESRNYDSKTPLPGYFPFVLDTQTIQQPVEMCVNFVVNSIQYRYKIEYKLQLEFEGLYVVENNVENSVYTISWKEGGKFVGGNAWRSTALDLSGDVVSNQLFLSLCGIKPKNGLVEVYEALAYLQAEPIGDSIDLKKMNESVAAGILKNSDSELFHRLTRLIKVSDTGIDGILMKEHSESEFKIPASIPENVKQQFIHENKWEFAMRHKVFSSGKETGSLNMTIQLESTGTKNLFGLGARVLNVLDTGGVLAYDEMNIAIHPALFRLLVSLFHNPKSNPHNAQLIFTTHDDSIAGDSLLRADQVWFAEKEESGASQLYSAQDFDDIGINVPFDSWYKSGRFGALPKFGNIDYIFDGGGEHGQEDTDK